MKLQRNRLKITRTFGILRKPSEVLWNLAPFWEKESMCGYFRLVGGTKQWKHMFYIVRFELRSLAL